MFELSDVTLKVEWDSAGNKEVWGEYKCLASTKLLREPVLDKYQTWEALLGDHYIEQVSSTWWHYIE